MKKSARFLKSSGFTLVELLIVMALMGVLAVAVLSAINPLEQINRARDTGYKNDAEQLISGLDRYYTTQQALPWKTVGAGGNPVPALVWTSAASVNPAVGICTGTGCADGELISAQELKPQFKGRKFITTATANDKIYVGKGTNASDSIYACFVPLSNSERQKFSTLKTITSGGSMPATGMPAACSFTVMSDWVGCGGTGDCCYVCLPE